jgi:hypothetical protein
MKNSNRKKASPAVDIDTQLADLDLDMKLAEARERLNDAQLRWGKAVDEKADNSVTIFEEIQETEKEISELEAQIRYRGAKAKKAESDAKQKVEADKQRSAGEYLDDLFKLGEEADKLFDGLESVSERLAVLIPASSPHGVEVMAVANNARIHFKEYVLFKITPMIGENALVSMRYEGKKYSDYLKRF